MEQVDFIFQLSAEEFEHLRRQFGTSSSWHLRSMVPLSSAVLVSIAMFRVSMGHEPFPTEEW